MLFCSKTGFSSACRIHHGNPSRRSRLLKEEEINALRSRTGLVCNAELVYDVKCLSLVEYSITESFYLDPEKV